MADENKKAQKKAEKELEKAKKERIKQSKPKKEGNVFTRMWGALRVPAKRLSGPTERPFLKTRRSFSYVLPFLRLLSVCLTGD